MNKQKAYLQSLLLAGEMEIPVELINSPVGAGSPRPFVGAVTAPLPEKCQTPNNNTIRSLSELRSHIGDCERCPLHKTRTNLVFGDGNEKAQIMFVGEAPGEEEDLQGLPFVGRSGQLLTKIIEAMGLQRPDVYIANVVKCRPPNNRNPKPEEITCCSPFLNHQIDIIQPKVIICLGTFAAQTLLCSEEKITALRKKFHPWPNQNYRSRYQNSIQAGSVKLLATYHPAYLLRNPEMKKEVWEDMKMVMGLLGLALKNK